jgi:hypothetical protein
MAISFVGASDMFSSAGTAGQPGSVTVLLPAISENDYLLAVCVSNQSVAQGAATPDFTFSTSDWVELTDPASSLTGNIRCRLYRKFAPAVPSDPQVTVSNRAGGWSAQIAAYAGVDQLTPEHLTVDDSHIAGSTTLTPGSRTTEDPDVVALAIAAADVSDTGITLSAAQSFTARMSGASYAAPSPSHHAVVLADREIATPGSVTMPTFTITSATTWVGLTLALQPQVGTLIQRTVSGTLAGTLQG